ncbi:hypothetical protein CCACVL1_13473, partial [Corchorus capsularis]
VCHCLAGTLMEMSHYFVLWGSALVVLLICSWLFCPDSPFLSLLGLFRWIHGFDRQSLTTAMFETIPRMAAPRLHGGVAVFRFGI